jgi:hypothetical protein
MFRRRTDVDLDSAALVTPDPLAARGLIRLGGVQSLSVSEYSVGQQPSPETQVVMVVWAQAVVQLALLPVIESKVQALLSLQEVGLQETSGTVIADASENSRKPQAPSSRPPQDRRHPSKPPGFASFSSA